MKKRLLALLLSTLMIAAIFSGCSTGKPEVSNSTDKTEDASNDTLAADQTITVGTEAHGGIYNYMYSSSAYDRQVSDLVYQRLVVSFDSGINRKNDLIVDKMEISEDGLEYTFTLKDGIKFSSGDDLTAEDIVFTYKALADPSSKAYFLDEIYKLDGAEEYFKGETEDFTCVEALNSKTVVFRFKDSIRTNISAASMGILSKNYYPDWKKGKSDDAMNEKMTKPIGSGPYLLEEYAAGQHAILVYNKDFWANDQTDYKIEKIIIKFVVGDTEINEIITKSVDVLPNVIDKEHVDRVKSEASDFVNITQFKRSAYGYIGFNTAVGSTANPAVRQAIAYAFNRKEFVASLYGDLARTLSVPMSQASSVFDAVEDDLEPYDFNLDKAKEVLTSAGYIYEGKTLTDPEGKKVVIKFLATTGNPVINALAPILSDNLKEIGIELDIQSIEFASMLPVIQNKDNNDWNMMFLAQTWLTDEPDTWYAAFHSNGIAQSNIIRYNNPELDKLLDKGRKFLDLTDSEAIDTYVEVAKILNRDMPQLPIYANILSSLSNKRVKNFKQDTFSDWHWAIEGAYISE